MDSGLRRAQTKRIEFRKRTRMWRREMHSVLRFGVNRDFANFLVKVRELKSV
jgi:hypothetical protein